MSLLIYIGGATASGKTALSLALAEALQAEIISCDARQFYREMVIGTAVPSKEELAQVPHHFLHSHTIEQPYSVGDYEREVLTFLGSYFQRKSVAIMVGGSGFYARAVCEGMDEYPDIPESVRVEVRQLFASQGLEALQKAVAQADPDYYVQVDQQNPVRLLRALEVCRATGNPFSAFHSGKVVQRPFKILKVGLDWDRAALYERIDRRVEQMMLQGLEQEARQLYPYRHYNALQTVGYQELFDYFDGKTGLEEAIALIQRNTRRYAKRQMTWLRRERDLHWIKCPIGRVEWIEAVGMLMQQIDIQTRSDM